MLGELAIAAWAVSVVPRNFAYLSFSERDARLSKMEYKETPAMPVGPKPNRSPEGESAALEQELELWAKLLLDVYLEKRPSSLGRKRALEGFDTLEHRQ